jgi:hypothetical protein
MTVTKVVDEDKKERQQRRIVLTLFSICILGFSYLIYDYFHIVNHTTLPEDFAQVDQTVQSWQMNGLVTSFEPGKAKIVVDEEKWKQMTKAEKIGMVTGLARFCAQGSRERPWEFEVVGKRTSLVMGELGSRGLVIP